MLWVPGDGCSRDAVNKWHVLQQQKQIRGTSPEVACTDGSSMDVSANEQRAAKQIMVVVNWSLLMLSTLLQDFFGAQRVKPSHTTLFRVSFPRIDVTRTRRSLSVVHRSLSARHSLEKKVMSLRCRQDHNLERDKQSVNEHHNLLGISSESHRLASSGRPSICTQPPSSTSKGTILPERSTVGIRNHP